MSMTPSWTALDYRKALNELTREVDPHMDAPGRWPTFLRQHVQDEIDRLKKEMCGILGMHDPAKQEQFNRLAGKIEGLQRLLLPDFGIGAALEDMIEEAR